MAKAKTKAAADSAPSAPSSGKDAEQQLKKMFGDGCILRGSDLIDRKPEILSISPALDAALGGGIIVGTGVTLAGQSGCGKTSTALHMVSKWQALGRKVYWLAVEPRIYERDLTGITGLRPEELIVIRSRKGRILNAQEFLNAAELIMEQEENAMLVIDSMSMLCDVKEMEKQGSEGLQPGGVNRIVGSFARKMSQVLPVNDNVVIVIAHVYANIGGKKKWKTSLPAKMEYLRGTGLTCNYHEYITRGDGDDARKTGQLIHWEVDRTLLPGTAKKVTSILRYGVGIDEVAEMIDIAKSLALISGSGWLTIPHLGPDGPKLNGQEKLREYLVENPEVMDGLRTRVMDLIS